MTPIIKVVWLILSLVILAAAPFYTALASPSAVEVPAGFNLILSAIGVQLYRKDYPGGSPDFVQVIDLSQGAVIKPLHGDVTEPRPGKGSYGGNDARMRSKTLGQYWQETVSANSNAFCVTNGQFFYMLEYPTRLPFPLKKDGQIVTDGYGIAEKPGEKLILELWPGRADIQELTAESLYGSTAPDIVAGLTEASNKRAKRSVGRTFVGIDDGNSDGFFEIILIYNTRFARQDEAAEVLRSFGADKVMMLDGGGSTQLMCQGNSYIFSERLIPQAMAVIAGDGSPPPPIELPPVSSPIEAHADAQSEAVPAEAAASPSDVVENTAAPAEPPPATDTSTFDPAATAGEASAAPVDQSLPASPPSDAVETNPAETPAVDSTVETTSVEPVTDLVVTPPAPTETESGGGESLPSPTEAVAPALSATFVNLPGWPIVLQGEPVSINVEILNSGSDSWKSGEYHLVVQKSPWGADEILPLQLEVQPGETIVFTWTAAPFSRPGVYSAQWFLSRGEEISPEQPLTWSVIVLPPELESLRPELQKELNLWIEQQEQDIDRLLQHWIQEQGGSPVLEAGSENAVVHSAVAVDEDSLNIDLDNVVWIPAVMLPFAAVLMIAIGRNRYRI